MVNAAAGALATLTSAKNPKYKKVLDAKQWNDRQRNVLAILDNEIVRRDARVVQNMVNSCKETAEAVLETQVMKVLKALVPTANLDSGTAVPSKGLQQTKTRAGASLANAHKHDIVRTLRKTAVAKETEGLELEKESEEQGPPRSRTSGNLQQQGPPGARNKDRRGRELPRSSSNRGL